MSRTRRRFINAMRWFKRYYRSPKTFNELKQLDATDDNYNPTNRQKARRNKLPTAWDDIVKSATLERYDKPNS